MVCPPIPENRHPCHTSINVYARAFYRFRLCSPIQESVVLLTTALG
jgi:hypothetical protein